MPGKDTVSVRILNTNVIFQAVQGSILIYKVFGGTLKVIIVGFDSFVRRYARENHNRQEVDQVDLIDENILIEPPD